MRYSTLRKKRSENAAAIRRWNDAVNGGADDSSMCSCSESSQNEEDNNDVGKVDFRKFGFTVFDVPGELTERRPGFETTVERKRNGGGVGSYGALISGAAFGAISMGVLMVRFSGCFHHAEYLGAFTPT